MAIEFLDDVTVEANLEVNSDSLYGTPTITMGNNSNASAAVISAQSSPGGAWLQLGYTLATGSAQFKVKSAEIHCAFDNASNPITRLTTTGLGIGLGAASPSEMLDIDGNLRLSGTFEDSSGNVGTAGQVLSSTGTGTDWIAAGGAGTNIGNSDLTITGNNTARKLILGTGVAGTFAIYKSGGTDLLIGFSGNGTTTVSPVTIQSLTSSGSSLKLMEATGGSNYIELKSPDSVSNNLTYTFPGTAPTAGQVLSSSAAGIMAWTDSSTADTNIANTNLTLTSSTRNINYFSAGGQLNFVYSGINRQTFSSQAVSYFCDFFLRSPSGSTTSPVMRFAEAQVNGSNFVSLQAAASLTTNTSYTLPEEAPPTGPAKVLQSTSTGIMSWVDAGDSTFSSLIASGGGRVYLFTSGDNNERATVLGGTLGFGFYNWSTQMRGATSSFTGLGNPGNTTTVVTPSSAVQGAFQVLKSGTMQIQGTVEGQNFTDVYNDTVYIYVFKLPASIVLAMGNGGAQSSSSYELVASAGCVMPASQASTRPQRFASGNGVTVSAGDWVFASLSFAGVVTATRYFITNFSMCTTS